MKNQTDPILFRSLVLRLERFVTSEAARKIRYQLGKKKIIPIITSNTGEDGNLYLYSFCSLGLRRFRQLGMAVESTALSPEEFLAELNKPNTPTSLVQIVEACERTASILSAETVDGFVDLAGPTRLN